MTFRNKSLQDHHDRFWAMKLKGDPDPLAIMQLMDAWHWFELVEEPESPAVAEAFECLLSPGARPASKHMART